MISDPAAQLRFLPPTASTFAERLDWLMLFLLGTSALLTLAVLALVVWFGLRYRRRADDEVPPERHASSWLEIVASLGLFGLFLVMFAWGAWLYIDARRPPRGALQIDVVGKQWMWKVRHPGGQREIDELHVPVGRPVRLNMISQDAIHSFSVPAFRIKQDVLPGSYTTLWFQATRPGEYHLFCQEYCGTGHSAMRGKVVAMTEDDYQAWLAGTPVDETPAATGQRLAASLGCMTCHSGVAPSFAGLYGREQTMSDGSRVVADAAYLRESILNPGARIVAGYAPRMPSYATQLNEEQVAALIAYIQSLGTATATTSPDSATTTSRPANGVVPDALPNQPPAIGGER